MSFNVGATFSKSITVFPSPETMTMTANTAAVTGVTNNAVDVSATAGSMALTPRNAQVGDDVIAQPDTASMLMSELAAVVDFTPTVGDQDVDATTGSMTMTGNTAGVVAPIPSLETDWNLRINQPGVVWYHNFNTAAEVDAFRWSLGIGNDPNDATAPARLSNTIEWDNTDGVSGGGCLYAFRFAGSAEGKDWWRPFSPMDTGSGKPVNDPGAAGRIPVVSWNPTQGGFQTQGYDAGYYGHPDYWPGAPSKFDGHGYWMQARIKIDPARLPQEPDGGKVFYFTVCEFSLSSQEIVVMSRQDANIPSPTLNFFDMYRSGSPPLRTDDPTNSTQPGTELGTCEWVDTGSGTNISGCWTWNLGEWDTYLFHIVPSLNSDNETLVEVYGAHPGDTAYTRFWNQDNVDLPYSASPENGHNALIASIYTNGFNMGTGFYQKFDEIIFSLDPIACPLTTPTELQTQAAGLSSGDFVDFTVHAGAENEDIQWMTESVYYDVLHREFQWMGKDAGPVDHTHYIYDEVSDTYQTVGTNLFPGSGHIWNKCFDPIEGDYYFRRSNTNSVEVYNRGNGAWTTTSSQTNPDLNSGNADFAAMGYHPNLFGPGKPGILCWAVFRAFAYNPKTDNWSVLNPSNFSGGSPYIDRRQGDAFYIQATDQLVIFAGQGGASSDVAIVVEAGAGASNDIFTDGLVSTSSSPPLPIQGLGGTANQGIIVKHPSEPDVLLCLEEHGTARVWRSDNYGATWALQGGTHPFDSNASPSMPTNEGEAGGFTCGTIWTHGVIIGITSNSSGMHPRLWKP